MLARFVLGALVASAAATSVMAAEMTADEARRFTNGKMFAFTCFEGTRGAGRVFEDGSAAGTVQFAGTGPVRHMRLPANTLQTDSGQVCASLKGLPFSPCFNLQKHDERSFRGSVSGMGFAYCEFQHKGAGRIIMARTLSNSNASANAKPRSLKPPAIRAAEASRTADVASRVETPRVEAGGLDPVQTGSSKADTGKVEGAIELRRSTN